jgi:hypothetical protein
MSLSIVVLSVCLFVLVGSLIACRFDLLRRPAKWLAFATASASIVSLLLLALDREGEHRPTLGFVLTENCPPTEQVAVTGSVRDSNRMLRGQEEDGIRERISVAKTQEAEARQRAEMAKTEEGEAWQRTKMAKAEEAAAWQRAEMAKLEEIEARRQLQIAQTEVVQVRQQIDMAKVKEVEARERVSFAQKEEAQARERAERAKAEALEVRHRADSAQAEADAATRRAKTPTIIRGGRKLPADNPM